MNNQVEIKPHEAEVKDDILFENTNRAGVITLDRPAALNALSLNMIEPIVPHYKKWAQDPHIYGIVMQSTTERAFCAGADVRQVVHAMADDPKIIETYFRTEYETNWAIFSFFKPTVPLIDGIVMGGGVGLSAYGTHCIMAENTRFAMPEVGIGLFPDVGMNYVLSRLPHSIGVYLALTGREITASDCYFLEIASQTVRRDKFPQIYAAMIESDPIDTVLKDLHEDFGPSEIAQYTSVIDRIFSGESVEEIFAKLREEIQNTSSAYRGWAKTIVQDMRSKSPLSLKVTLRLLQEGRKQESLKGSLELDYHLVRRFADDSDFKEGVRATLIDKDYRPKWKHKSIEDVSDTLVDDYFEGSGKATLNFIDYGIRH